MKKFKYFFIIKYTLSGLFIGFLLILASATYNYYRGFHGSFLHIFRYSPDFVIILFSPVLLSFFLGFIGFRREQLVHFNKKIIESLFKEQTRHSDTDRQLKLLAKVVAQVNEGIIISDRNGNIEWVNDGFTKINGYKIDDIKGKRLNEILYGSLTDKSVSGKMTERLANGKAAIGELLTYHKDGSILWSSISIKPIFDAEGALGNFTAIQNNITKRREKEIAIEKLYKEVGDYKFALDQSAIVIKFNNEGKIIHVNNKFCEINELSREELMGKDYRSVNISLRSKAIIKPIWERLNAGKPWNGELINRNKNGKTYWANTTIVPLLDEDGKPREFLSIQQNITKRKELENQLISNKNKLQEAMKIARLGSWEMDNNGVLNISDELKFLYNIPLHETVHLNQLFNNIHPDDVETMTEKMALAKNNLKTIEIEYRYLINGEVHYMISTNTPKLNNAGECIGSFGTVQDITAAKTSALALKKSEEEKAIVFNNTQTIICVHDLSGKIMDINAAAEKMSGFNKTEIIGKNLKSILFAEHYKKFDEYLQLISDNNTANGTIQVITKSGAKRVWLYHNVVYANNGNAPYVIASAIDISESVQANKEIERQQHFIRQIIDNSPNVIFVLDEDKKIILANKNFAKYYPHNENTTPSVSSLTIDSNDTFLGDVDNIFEMEDGEMIRWEGSKINPANGIISWFTIINKCFKEKNGKKYVLVYGMDITGRHKIETELIAANELVEHSLKVKEQFISNMSHEIRTPLNAVIGFNDLLGETIMNKEQATYVEIVKTASSNLLSLINNILDLSKIESGNLLLENVPINIKNIITDAVKIFEPKARLKDLKIQLHIDENIPEKVMGDQLRLNQIMYNLIGNAIKFTDEGYIEVSCKKGAGSNASKQYIHFSIEDTGIGVAPDKQMEIFERFTQAKPDTQRLYGGTGLGLNITKNIMDLYGGTLTMESVPGRGTTFNFTIPFNHYINSIDIAAEKAFHFDDIISAATNKPVHILLAEDNSINAMLATQVLTNKGFTIVHVSNGALAVEAVQKERFDVVLMDIQMPVMNGIAASKAIRELSTIPIIAMTAHSLQSEMENCYEAGMNGYVSKPFKPNDLFTTIFQVVHKPEVKIREEII